MPSFTEARIYLANLLYDRGETEAALHHLERTQPDDHFDELGIWRHIELKKTVYRLPDDDPELTPWLARLAEVAGEPDPIDMLLAEVEARRRTAAMRDPHQLELFGTLLSELHAMQKQPGQGESHLVVTLCRPHASGARWEEILFQMKAADREWAHGSPERLHGQPCPPGPRGDRRRDSHHRRRGVHSRQRRSRRAADRPVARDSFPVPRFAQSRTGRPASGARSSPTA